VNEATEREPGPEDGGRMPAPQTTRTRELEVALREARRFANRVSRWRELDPDRAREAARMQDAADRALGYCGCPTCSAAHDRETGQDTAPPLTGAGDVGPRPTGPPHSGPYPHYHLTDRGGRLDLAHRSSGTSHTHAGTGPPLFEETEPRSGPGANAYARPDDDREAGRGRGR
jgi:hypothetical protein